jgi:hypothetical protein
MYPVYNPKMENMESKTFIQTDQALVAYTVLLLRLVVVVVVVMAVAAAAVVAVVVVVVVVMMMMIIPKNNLNKRQVFSLPATATKIIMSVRLKKKQNESYQLLRRFLGTCLFRVICVYVCVYVLYMYCICIVYVLYVYMYVYEWNYIFL